jgi:hypothetical protein
MRATATDFPDFRGYIARFDGVYGGFGPDAACQFQTGIIDVNGNRPGAHRLGNHDGGQPDTAAAVHGQPLALGDPALVDDGPE